MVQSDAAGTHAVETRRRVSAVCEYQGAAVLGGVGGKGTRRRYCKERRDDKQRGQRCTGEVIHGLMIPLSIEAGND